MWLKIAYLDYGTSCPFHIIQLGKGRGWKIEVFRGEQCILNQRLPDDWEKQRQEYGGEEGETQKPAKSSQLKELEMQG